MQIMLTIIHVLVCVFLTLVVLLQQGNKQGMGGAFGGSSSTVFGGRGANTFLQKLTAGAAIVFMLTSLSLSYLSSRTGSAFDSEPAAPAPAKPAEDKPAPSAPPLEQGKPAEGAAPAGKPAEKAAEKPAGEPGPATK